MFLLASLALIAPHGTAPPTIAEHPINVLRRRARIEPVRAARSHDDVDERKAKHAAKLARRAKRAGVAP
jgi:hypothetical protein